MSHEETLPETNMYVGIAFLLIILAMAGLALGAPPLPMIIGLLVLLGIGYLVSRSPQKVEEKGEEALNSLKAQGQQLAHKAAERKARRAPHGPVTKSRRWWE